MFGMNSKDNDATDDARAARRRVDEQEARTASSQISNAQEEINGMSAIGAIAVYHVRKHQRENAKLRKKLDTAIDEQKELIAVVYGANAALNALISELSVTTGESKDTILKRANSVKNKTYNRQLDEWLSSNEMLTDPRADPEIKKKRTWFIPQV
ncbi:hypothetical protein D3C87_291870 [compost metagenome]